MNLSIKNVPADVVERLRWRAAHNHRSLQGELAAIVEAAANERRKTSVQDVHAEVKKLGLSTPSESAAIVRADRDRDDRR